MLCCLRRSCLVGLCIQSIVLIIKPHLHDTSGCPTGWPTGWAIGWVFVYTIQPVVQPVWQPIVLCKWDLTVSKTVLFQNSSAANCAWWRLVFVNERYFKTSWLILFSYCAKICTWCVEQVCLCLTALRSRNETLMWLEGQRKQVT